MSDPTDFTIKCIVRREAPCGWEYLSKGPWGYWHPDPYCMTEISIEEAAQYLNRDGYHVRRIVICDAASIYNAPVPDDSGVIFI